MGTIQRKAFDIAVKSLNKQSKFYNEDKAELERHYSRMTDSKAKEVYARQLAIASVTKEEINRNCQLGGLRKLG